MPTTVSGTDGVDKIKSSTIESTDFSTTAQLPLANTVYSMVRLHTGNGYGSTNTAIRRYTTVVTNQGSDITYADSATLGATFTINTNGIYAISCCDSFNTSTQYGISLNSTQLTTGITSITAADRLINVNCTGESIRSYAGWTGFLAAGDVIRGHGNPTPNSANPGLTSITITRIA